MLCELNGIAYWIGSELEQTASCAVGDTCAMCSNDTTVSDVKPFYNGSRFQSGGLFTIQIERNGSVRAPHRRGLSLDSRKDRSLGSPPLAHAPD